MDNKTITNNHIGEIRITKSKRAVRVIGTDGDKLICVLNNGIILSNISYEQFLAL